MPFRLNFPNRAKIQFTTAAWMPSRIYQACQATGILSNTVYCQRAVCEALARDLGLDLQALLDDLPAARGPAAHLYDPADHAQARFGDRVLIGPANTIEEVR